MIKIFINCKFLSAKLTGVQRFGLEVSDRLQARFEKMGFKVILLTPPHWISISKFRTFFVNLWEQVYVPFISRCGYILNLCNSGPVFKNGGLTVIHDAAIFDMPDSYSRFYRTWSSFQVKKLSRNASCLVTVSEFSAKRLSLALNYELSRFNVIREGCDHIHEIVSDNGIMSRLGLSRKSYVLAVGSMQKGKNFKSILEAATSFKLGFPLVIAGGGDGVVFSSDVNLDKSKYIHAGYVTDGELKSLYENASCFVQASLYEGFGIPLVEAMSVGTPVVCSNAASLPEVCGDAAVYFDPHDSMDIAYSVNKVLGDESLRSLMVKKGLERAEYFSWDLAVDDLVNLILLDIARGKQ